MRRLNYAAVLVAITAVTYFSCKSREQGSLQLQSQAQARHKCSFALSSAPTHVTPPNTYQLSWDVFHSLAQASRLAYDKPTQIQQTMKNWGFKTVDVADQGALTAYVASNDECMVVAFRGTNEIRDWLTNGQILGRDVKNGRMHRGFGAGFDSLKAQIYTYMKAQGANKKTVWVTGHSLGGALAGVLAYENDAMDMPKSDITFEKIVTFGQPLFADSPLAKYLGQTYRGRYFRIVHKKDIVARVPPGYQHFGSLVWFRGDQIVYQPQLSSAFAAAAAAMGAGTRGSHPPAADPDAELEPNQAEFDAYMQEYEDTAKSGVFESGSRGFSPSATLTPRPPQSAVAASAFPSPSFVDDHSMLHYTRVVGEQL